MSDIPIPMPDRRTLGHSTNSLNKSTNTNKFKSPDNNEKYNENSINIKDSIESPSLSIVKLKQVEDMRRKILSYKLLTEQTIFFSGSPGNSKVNKCNVILFGPSGSGKSSFIKSLYRALYDSPIMPPEATSKLKVKSRLHNEGTLCFTKLHLVEETENTSGITLCDTRGHIKMNENEMEQFKILLEGNVKDGVKIEQRVNRDPLALWEFWKRPSELFPSEIFNPGEPGISSLPHSVVFVFDGSTDEIIPKEDEKFYKDLVNISIKKGYTNIQIILTRIDLFEKMFFERNKNLSMLERNTKLNTLKDTKIEQVIQTLGVSRSNIHFLENYHLDEQVKNSVEIDYHILKTMIDILNSSEIFMMYYMNKKESCFCFGGNYFFGK